MTTLRITVAAIMLVGGLASASTAQAQFGNPGLSSNFGGASFGGNSYGLGASGGGSTGTFGSRSLGTSLSPRTRTFASGFSSVQANNFADSGQFTAYPGSNQTNRFAQPGEGLQYAGDLANTNLGGTNLGGTNLGGANLGGANYGGMVNPGVGQVNPGVNPNYLPYGAYNSLPQQLDTGGAKNATLAPARKADIEYPSPPETVFSAAVTAHLERSLRERITEPLSANYQGRTLILRGAVATDHDRALAERLALLEPRVEAVRNELLVRPQSGARVAAADHGFAPEGQRDVATGEETPVYSPAERNPWNM